MLLLAAAGCAGGQPAAPTLAAEMLDPAVADGLRRMSTTLARAPSLGFRLTVQRDGVLPNGQQVLLRTTAAIALQRPNRLVALAGSDRGNFRLSYDGQTAALIDLDANSFAQMSFSGGADALLVALEERFDVEIPIRDLLAADPYPALITPDTTGVVVGQTVIDGVICDHFALRSGPTDWQIWIEAGERALPRMLATVDRTLAERPRTLVALEDWALSPRLSPQVFRTQRPAGATDMVLPDRRAGVGR